MAWRRKLAAASVNRVQTALKAALNLLADHDEGIGKRQAWDIGLKSIPDAEESRNVILAEPAVRTVIAEARRENAEFGLLVEVAAATGARVSQLARRNVAKRAKLDPDEVTMYALRHSNIVRQLLVNVPIRVVAATHDMSVAMIERTYSRDIGDHADSLIRPVLLDTASVPAATDNVAPIGAAR
jgi:hypothetical protein